jgi:hypothetical protein
MAGLEEPKKPKDYGGAAGTVAIILAIGISIALNVITIALLWAAAIRLAIDPKSGLSDNGVQVLLAWGGGIISVLAGYVGYIVGKKNGQNGKAEPDGSSTPPPDRPDV